MANGTLTMKLPEREIVDLCRKIISGTWMKVTDEEVSFQLLSGLSNYLYKVSLHDHVISNPGEVRTVLFRIYGEIIRSDPEAALLDTCIFALLSEKRIGPRLYGAFNGGRIEEFIESQPLRIEMMRRPEVSVRIAEQVARLHRLHMPINKQPSNIFRSMDLWLKNLITLIRQGGKDKRDAVSPSSVTFDTINEFLSCSELEKELDWIKFVFSHQHSADFKVVFCHNDVQANNILWVNDPDHPDGFRLQLIDFEYCSYNYRAFDIGNHFNEWCFDYTIRDGHRYLYRQQDYPDRDEQLRFWSKYLAGTTKEPLKLEDEEALLTETKYGSLLSHLYWTLWSVFQSQISSISFGFMEYAVCRCNSYKQLKAELLSTHTCPQTE